MRCVLVWAAAHLYALAHTVKALFNDDSTVTRIFVSTQAFHLSLQGYDVICIEEVVKSPVWASTKNGERLLESICSLVDGYGPLK